MFEMKITGLGEFQRSLERITAIGRTNQVPLTEVFPPAFMRRYTDVGTFEELIEAGGFTVQTQQDFEAIPDAEWDTHIAHVTRFPNWQAMLEKGATEWMTRKIGL